MTNVLVTGGAGLIGSHIVDAALAQGWNVRVLDCLEPQTHRNGKPPWINAEVDFVQGDVRNRATWEQALLNIDIVFHEAAYGGYMPEIAKFIEVNGVGTALMLETIRDHQLPVKKIVMASSQAVYNEGAYDCPTHGRFFGQPRPVTQLRTGDFAMHCPQCGQPSIPGLTNESAPTGGANTYAISKGVQERLLLTWGEATGVPVVALRYACTFGPRQSIFNPYTGVIAIFCTRLVNNLPPVVYEDGLQQRDLIFVEDVARANILVAKDERANGRVFNVGTGKGVCIGELAELLAAKLAVPLRPEITGRFRPGEMRALVSDSAALGALGFAAETSLEDGIERYLAWIDTQGSIEEYFSAAERTLQERQMVQQS